jgi:DNA-binding CsgD family transcriptional regulator
MPYCPPGWTPLPPESKTVTCFGGLVTNLQGKKNRAAEAQRLSSMGLTSFAIARRLNCSRATVMRYL